MFHLGREEKKGRTNGRDKRKVNFNGGGRDTFCIRRRGRRKDSDAVERGNFCQDGRWASFIESPSLVRGIEGVLCFHECAGGRVSTVSRQDKQQNGIDIDLFGKVVLFSYSCLPLCPNDNLSTCPLLVNI